MMVKKTENINDQDIQYIMENPWDLSKSEWQLEDEASRKDTLVFINTKLDLCKKDGFMHLWETMDGHAIAILGFFNIGPKLYETFFIASKHMNECGMKVSFELRRLLEDKESSEYRGCTCRLFSLSDHPKQINWFKFIGFEYLPHKSIGDHKYFEYISKTQ